MTHLVCLDNNILSWFLRTCRDKDENKMDRAQALVDTLHKNKAIVAIPSIVLAEAICIIPDSDIQRAMDCIRSNFPVFQFNELAAFHYRTIFQKAKNIETDASRWSKFADLKIIATAKAHGASCLYSEDPDMTKLADGTIKVEGLPLLPPQQKKLPIIHPLN